jgi:hypothetical protein
MTNQEIFDKAYAHGFTMKNMAKDYESLSLDCMYRAPNGEKCLIGGFIPDEKYIPSMELVISDLVFDKKFRLILDEIGLTIPYEQNSVTTDEILRNEFLSCLQSCHDDADSLEDMFVNMQKLAQDYQLQIPR